MKNVIALAIISLLASCSGSPVSTNVKDKSTDSISTQLMESTYDSLYAHKLGADKYGMKTYVMAFLKEGPNKDIDSTESVQLQKLHLENIQRLAENGKLVLAGPFFGNPNSDLAGIYIFDVATIIEAEELTKTDPAVKAGSLTMELHLWYGSAALLEVNNIHNKIAKENP